ncbi:MAG TPA: TolC family protein, partial [Spirochaetia bacterium]
TLSECVDAALGKGDELAIIRSTLAVSRAQYEQAVSSNSFSLSGTTGYGVSGATGDSSLVETWSSQTGTSLTGALPQDLNAALTLSSPMTSLSLGGMGILPLIGSTSYSSLVSLGATQTLWDGYPGGTTKATVEKSQLSLRQTENTSDTDTKSLVYEVKQAYLTLLAAQRTLDVKNQIVTQQESALAQMEASFKLQQATAVDLQTARINVTSARIDVATEKDTLRAAHVTLANLMGADPDAPFTVAEIEATSQSGLSLSEAIAKGLSQSSELKNLSIDLQTSDIDLALIQGQKTPTVSVSGAGYMMFGVAYPTQAAALAASLSLSMPVLDAGSARHKIEENRASRSVTTHEISQKKKSISLEIETAYNSLQRQRDNLELYRLKAENAEAYYQVEKTGNQYGTVTAHDVLAASVDAASAKVSYAKARSDVLLAELALQNAMGD